MTSTAHWSPLRDKNAPILAALMLANALIAMDATILATAVPSVVDDLGDYSRFPWLFSAYLLTQAVTIPVYGKLSDIYGRKPVIIFGITVFLGGSVLAALAPTMTVLIVARLVQGFGAGAIGPIVMTVLGDIYTLAQRGKVQGYMASVWAIASVVGPTLGGLFAELDAWRWIFWINVPLSLIAGLLILQHYKDPGGRTHQQVDYAGAAVLTLSLAALILGTLEGGESWAWLSWQSLTTFGIGAIGLAVLPLIERRATQPIVEFGLLSRRLITGTALAMLCVGVLTVGVTSFTPTYLQTSAGVSPIVAGLAVAAMTLGWPLASARSAHFYLSRGFRTTILIGSFVTVTGSIALAATAQWPSVWFVAAFTFVMGLGLGLVAAPSTVAAQNSVGWEQRGQVTGITTFARSAGSAVGVAILGAVSNAVISARGGEASPENLVAATQAVFIGVVVAAVLVSLSGLLIPRDDPRRASESDAAHPAQVGGAAPGAGSDPADAVER